MLFKMKISFSFNVIISHFSTQNVLISIYFELPLMCLLASLVGLVSGSCTKEDSNMFILVSVFWPYIDFRFEG